MQTTTSLSVRKLLAFLPLFGEDWDLDSLTIYATSELATPEWCAHPGCMSLCSDENFLIVPPDADIVYHDQISEQRLLLPPTPKTLVIFGIANYTARLSRETVLCENGENSWAEVASIAQLQPYSTGMTILMGFNGEWWSTH